MKGVPRMFDIAFSLHIIYGFGSIWRLFFERRSLLPVSLSPPIQEFTQRLAYWIYLVDYEERESHDSNGKGDSTCPEDPLPGIKAADIGCVHAKEGRDE